MLRVLTVLALLLPLPGLGADRPACDLPPELLHPEPLPAAAAAIAHGHLHILAIGSASVLGAGGTSPAAAWPERLRAVIAARRPNLDVTVEVRGGRGLSATDQRHLLNLALGNGRIDLVIWQAGATEAVRGLPVDGLTDVLTPALQQLRARDVDAIVMDLQFSRFLRANADVEPYREALRIAAAAAGVPLFPRYELMNHWADADSVDVERAARDARPAEVDRLNGCIADALAAFIREGVREARRPPP